MSPEQKEEIYKLRLQGMGYKAIAGKLLLTVDVIKHNRISIYFKTFGFTRS